MKKLEKEITLKEEPEEESKETKPEEESKDTKLEERIKKLEEQLAKIPVKEPEKEPKKKEEEKPKAKELSDYSEDELKTELAKRKPKEVPEEEGELKKNLAEKDKKIELLSQKLEELEFKGMKVVRQKEELKEQGTTYLMGKDNTVSEPIDNFCRWK